MSLKIRLVLIVSAVLSIGIALGAAVLSLRARAAMHSEMDTALRSAERLISAVRSQPGLASLRPEDLTESLDRLRHVRVIRPGAGPPPPRNMHVAGVPRWFSRLIAPATEGLESINLTVGDLTVGGAHEQVILQADPSDEIREVWQDVRVIMVIAAAMCLCVGGLVYLGLARVRPLADLEAAFDRLEAGDFETRVSERAVPELQRIHKRFNHMAAVLCSTRDRERALASHLVDLQEAERRSLAQELHDDMAPLLFTISVHLTTIHSFLQGRQYTAIPEALGASEKTVAELQERIRAMLRRLRPLGSRRSVRAAVAPTHGGTGKPAGARQVVDIQVEDDGKGMRPETPFGLGLMGIEERVEALGGALAGQRRSRAAIEPRATSGTALETGENCAIRGHSRLNARIIAKSCLAAA